MTIAKVAPLFLVAAAVVASCGDDSTPHRGADLGHGWTKLPNPQQLRGEAAMVWTGEELLSWGGCDPASPPEDCEASREAGSLRLGEDRWNSIDPAPIAAAGARGFWTGDEAVFVVPDDLACCGVFSGPQPSGAAYNPQEGTWRQLAEAPVHIHSDGVRVWTGHEVIVWGGGGRKVEDVRAGDGAAYDVESDRWRRIPPAPIRLNQVTGVWTGEEVVVFGSLLDGRNKASTSTSVGAAYDPARDRWRRIPASALSPQATAAVRLGNHVLAWDYELRSQEFDPKTDSWSRAKKIPLRFYECYPSGAAGKHVAVGLFCSQAALYEGGEDSPRSWSELRGGPFEAKVRLGDGLGRAPYWFGHSIAPAGDAVILSLHAAFGDAPPPNCDGCEGDASSLWAFRP